MTFSYFISSIFVLLFFSTAFSVIIGGIISLMPDATDEFKIKVFRY